MGAGNDEITTKGKNARAEYLREWRRRNRDKCREYAIRYWSRKAEQQTDSKTKGSVTTNEQF